MPEKDPPFLLFARAGFAARGLLYLLVAWLALKLGREEDAGGALGYFSSGGGRLLLAGMAVGFLGYGAWRLVDAALDSEAKGDGWKGLRHRLAAGGSGLIHLGLAYSAASQALGGRSGGGSSRTAEAGAATAMTLPGGTLLLFAAALTLALVGLWQFNVGLRRRFLRHLRPEAERHVWLVAAGAVGYSARGAIFAVAAWLMLGAALHHRPAEAGGLGDALAALPESARGAVAGGLALFGLFSLLEAWFRAIRDPGIEQRVKSAAT